MKIVEKNEELKLKIKICSIVYKSKNPEYEDPTHIIYKYSDIKGEKVIKSAVLLTFLNSY